MPEIRVEMQPKTTAKAVIRIMDNGIGLPPDRARLFEPYVTTREKGTGLGLPIVKKIIEEHGGTLALLDAARLRRQRPCRRHGRDPPAAARQAPAGRNIGPQPAGQGG